MNTEQYIDHETRIRVQEKISEDIKLVLTQMDDKMDNQFKWIVITIVFLLIDIILLTARSI